MTTWFTRSITLMNASRQRMATGQADPVRTPGTRQRRNADSTQPDPIPANRGRDQSPENADVQARAQRRQAMEKQFASIRDQTDRIHDHAVREVLKVLTSRQRANFEKLLGEPFDPSRITSVRRDGSSPSAQNREAPESLDRKNGRGETDDEPRSDRDS
jgi:hypothetical protein